MFNYDYYCKFPCANKYDVDLAKERYITVMEQNTSTEPSNSLPHYLWKLEHPSDSLREVGYHFGITDEEIFQFAPANRKVVHASFEANGKSISVLRYDFHTTDRVKAIYLQAKLIATLMHKFDIPIDHVVPHKHWNPRIFSPARIFTGVGWNDFISIVTNFYIKDTFEIENILIHN